MLISQILRPDGSLAVVAREGSEAAVVKGAASTYALAEEAIASGQTLAATIAAHGLGEAVDLSRLLDEGRVTLPVTHPDPAHLHLTGTDFMEPLQDAALAELQPYWSVTLESESPTLYRSEYLAGQVLQDAAAGREGLSLDALQRAALDSEALNKLVRDYAAAQLAATPLLVGGETVPPLAEVLALVAGRAPLLIEV